jgi:hypothetical protein
VDVDKESLRQVYAAIALHGLLSNPAIFSGSVMGMSHVSITTVGGWAATIADDVVRGLDELPKEKK